MIIKGKITKELYDKYYADKAKKWKVIIMITKAFADMIDKEIMNRNNMKNKNIEINYLAAEVARLTNMVDNLDKAIEQHLNKENLIMNELVKEGYTINFSEDENGELKCNLNKEEQ